MSVVSVDELRRAWTALEAGQFRSHRAPEVRGSDHAPTAHAAGETSTVWTPGGSLIAVAGVSGHVGTSTAALAIATAAARSTEALTVSSNQGSSPVHDDGTHHGTEDSARGGAAGGTTVRLIECAPAYRVGTAAASTAELGTAGLDAADASWRRGRRGPVMIERLTGAPSTPAHVPVPAAGRAALTVVDTGWDITSVTSTAGWLSRATSDHPLVLTTVATVPGLRVLETALGSLSTAHPIWCAVLGLRRRRWAAPLRRACGHSIVRARDEGRLLTVPHLDALAVAGLTPDPLPAPVVSTFGPLLEHVLAEMATTKGNLPCD